jgi:hypothetical protein
MKKYFSLLHFLSCLLVLLLSGCVSGSSGIESKTIAAPDVSSLQHRTYAWYQSENIAPASFDEGFNAELDVNLRKAIEDVLRQKGMKMVTLNPDVLIAYDVSVDVPKEKDKPDAYIPGFGYGYAFMAGYRYNYSNTGIWGYRSVDLYKQGTLIIDVIKPDDQQLLWRGWSEGAISNYKANYKKIHQQVEEVLKDFGK